MACSALKNVLPVAQYVQKKTMKYLVTLLGLLLSIAAAFSQQYWTGATDNDWHKA